MQPRELGSSSGSVSNYASYEVVRYSDLKCVASIRQNVNGVRSGVQLRRLFGTGFTDHGSVAARR